MNSPSENTILLRQDDHLFGSDADNDNADHGVGVHDTLFIEDTLEEPSVSILYLFTLTCGVGG
jgi:hypothetical protein